MITFSRSIIRFGRVQHSLVLVVDSLNLHGVIGSSEIEPGESNTPAKRKSPTVLQHES